MYFIYLISKDRGHTLYVCEDKKQVYNDYPPNLHMIELLETCKDKQLVKIRIPIIQKNYKESTIHTPFSLKKNLGDMIKEGWRYEVTEQERDQRKRRIAGDRNPNYGGLSEEHRKKISQSSKGKPGTNTGKKFSGHTRKLMSMAKKGNQHSAGLRWIYNPYTEERRRIKNDEELPEGFYYGVPDYVFR